MLNWQETSPGPSPQRLTSAKLKAGLNFWGVVSFINGQQSTNPEYMFGACLKIRGTPMKSLGESSSSPYENRLWESPN